MVNGSWFIQGLCETLQRSAGSLEFLELLTLVNMKVSRARRTIEHAADHNAIGKEADTLLRFHAHQAALLRTETVEIRCWIDNLTGPPIVILNCFGGTAAYFQSGVENWWKDVKGQKALVVCCSLLVLQHHIHLVKLQEMEGSGS
ncbi:Caspase-6 [Merluccius polli]|uniref:Caspase-6 n=1 Tax=Merluccius polli TaxID=89951 RepID=A0AA47MMM1_MERPO|nr:Caspase-6 [Merluccius polli]